MRATGVPRSRRSSPAVLSIVLLEPTSMYLVASFAAAYAAYLLYRL